MEEVVERCFQLRADVAVIGDVDSDEHGLVDLAAEVRIRFVVGAVEVGDEGKSGLEVPFHSVELELQGAESFLDEIELGGNSILLGSEQIERDRASVMGFEELAALGERAALPGHELLSLEACVLAEISDLLENDLLGLEPEVFAEVQVPVEVCDRFFDVVDPHCTLGAASWVALAADADEVGIDSPCVALGVRDDEAAAALAPLIVLLAAEDRPFEVVVMQAPLLASEVRGR